MNHDPRTPYATVVVNKPRMVERRIWTAEELSHVVRGAYAQMVRDIAAHAPGSVPVGVRRAVLPD